MTEHETPNRETMDDVSHTNPNDPRNVFGELFRRGPTTVADGGRRDESNDDATMRDVSHEDPNDEEGNVNRVWDRGKEKTRKDVE